MNEPSIIIGRSGGKKIGLNIMATSIVKNNDREEVTGNKAKKTRKNIEKQPDFNQIEVKSNKIMNKNGNYIRAIVKKDRDGKKLLKALGEVRNSYFNSKLKEKFQILSIKDR